jgi:RNA polymerase sigma factor (sigma-70 family)
VSKATKDKEILEAIHSGRDDKALEHLYTTLLPKITQMICANSGGSEEANDIFQDAMLIFYKQVKEGKFDDQYEVSGFIYTICRNLWINRAKRKQRSTELTNKEFFIESDSDIELEILNEERSELVMGLLSKLGERCKELLMCSIFYKYSMKEICQIMGFSTENAAKTRNYKCKQKLLKLIEENPSLKTILK